MRKLRIALYRTVCILSSDTNNLHGAEGRALIPLLNDERRTPNEELSPIDSEIWPVSIKFQVNPVIGRPMTAVNLKGDSEGSGAY